MILMGEYSYMNSVYLKIFGYGNKIHFLLQDYCWYYPKPLLKYFYYLKHFSKPGQKL